MIAKEITMIINMLITFPLQIPLQKVKLFKATKGSIPLWIPLQVPEVFILTCKEYNEDYQPFTKNPPFKSFA
jgi:hypothetical protein